MSKENLYQINSIQKKISILEMIEKLKSCGLVWQQQDTRSWKTIHNDGEAVWELTLTKVTDSESNGDENIKFDVILLDFKKNDSYFYTIRSDQDLNLLEMWDEIVGDAEFEKEESLLRDLHTASKLIPSSIIRLSSLGGLIAGTPNEINIHEFIPESYGLRIKKTKTFVEQILPNYEFRGPRKLAIWGDKIYVASETNPVCVLDQNENYTVSGLGWINVIDGSLKNQVFIPVTNRVVALPITCSHIAVSNKASNRSTGNYIGHTPNVRSKIYSSGLYGESVIVTNIEKQNFEKFIYTQHQTASMFLNQNLNLLYVFQTKMDINNQVWRFDLPFGPPYPPTGNPVSLPVVPPSIPDGPPFFRQKLYL